MYYQHVDQRDGRVQRKKKHDVKHNRDERQGDLFLAACFTHARRDKHTCAFLAKCCWIELHAGFMHNRSLNALARPMLQHLSLSNAPWDAKGETKEGRGEKEAGAKTVAKGPPKSMLGKRT